MEQEDKLIELAESYQGNRLTCSLRRAYQDVNIILRGMEDEGQDGRQESEEEEDPYSLDDIETELGEASGGGDNDMQESRKLKEGSKKIDEESSNLYDDAISVLKPEDKDMHDSLQRIKSEDNDKKKSEENVERDKHEGENSMYHDAMSHLPALNQKVLNENSSSNQEKTSNLGEENESNDTISSGSGSYPWMSPRFQLDPQPLPGLAQTNIYELAQPLNKSPPTPPKRPSRHNKVPTVPVDDGKEIAPLIPIAETMDILQQQTMDSNIYELAANPVHFTQNSQSKDVFQWENNKSYVVQSQSAPAQGATVIPEETEEDDQVGELVYDTVLDFSGSYDQLRKLKASKTGSSSEHLYGVRSGKDIEFSSSFDGMGKFKKKSSKDQTKKKTAQKSTFHLESGSYDDVANGGDTEEEPVYEDIGEGTQYEQTNNTLMSTCSTATWGSDFSDEDIEYPDRPLPPPPRVGHFKTFHDQHEDDDCPLQPVKINFEKHPPPALPQTPKNLSGDQDKKRRVVGCIIDSEKSYIKSLERIIQDYKSALLFTYGLNRTCVKTIMTKTQEILNHHLMFQIELAASVTKWDQNEAIGGIFTASFSRSMVVDVYSTYVNNFAIAMDEIKSAQVVKPGLTEFLNMTAQKSMDRLSVFALMVKPIQRFPQFIMFMQDLLKYTPYQHHDRSALQRALTDLENVAHKLNERKRESEQIFNAKQLHNMLHHKVMNDKVQRLIRKEDLKQMDTIGSGQVRTKMRHVILMDDSLICCSFVQKEFSTRQKEPYRLKWTIPLSDLELKESSITPDMHTTVRNTNNVFSVYSPILESKDDDLFHLSSDIQDFMHDMEVLKKVSGLMTMLKNAYDGLTVEIVEETIGDIQQKILVKDQQLQLVNCSSIILHDHARKTRYIFHTHTPEQKQEWCIDFLMAKLTQDPQNNPGWDMSSMGSVENDVIHQPAMYMKWMSVDMPRHYTKVKCAVPVFLTPSGSHDISIQHLWVVTTTEERAQVSLVSIQTTKPVLIESFQAADMEIIAVETVPGFATVEQNNAFLEDTVWMSTRNSRILVYSLFDEDGIRRKTTGARKPRSNFYCHGIATVIRYADDRVFVGLSNGNLMIYDRNQDGAWMMDNPNTVKMISEVSVSCIIAIDDEIWVACGDTFYIVPVDECIYTESLKCDGGAAISEMVRSGCGLWVSFKNKSYVRLYHLETKENLQEINVSSAVGLTMKESPYKPSHKTGEECVVTSLMSSRGLLWVGTSVGIICTLPLPRLRDGVPLVNRRPNVSFHAHNGPVQFLFPIYCGTVNMMNESQPVDVSQSNIWKNNASFKVKPRNGLNQMSKDALSPNQETKPINDAEKSSNPEIQSTDKLQNKMTEAVDRKKENNEDVDDPDDQKVVLRKARSLENLDESQNDKFLNLQMSADHSSGGSSKRKTLTLRTELAQKIKARQRAITDLHGDKEDHEVDRYFSDLMSSPERKSDENVSKMTSPEREASPDNHSEKPEEKTLQNKKVKKFSFSKEKDESASSEKGSTLKSIRKSLSFFKPRVTSGHEIVQKSSSVRLAGNDQSTTYEAMRKKNCNAVIVISGGDGYIDWRKEKNVESEKNTEASLMSWMYKY